MRAKGRNLERLVLTGHYRHLVVHCVPDSQLPTRHVHKYDIVRSLSCHVILRGLQELELSPHPHLIHLDVVIDSKCAPAQLKRRLYKHAKLSDYEKAILPFTTLLRTYLS